MMGLGTATYPCSRGGALSQHRPGLAGSGRAPGVCLQEPKGADVVAGEGLTLPPPTPPGAVQVQRQKQVSEDRLSRASFPSLADNWQISISEGGAREAPEEIGK